VLQARILEEMHKEQAAAIRARSIRNWVLLPAALACLGIGIAFMFSDDMIVSFLANTVATGIAIVLWRINREWIRDRIGV